MKTEHLVYLLEVAQSGSINKASKKLFIKQQHLSQIITSLETDLGIAIFERNNKGITPTADGKVLIEKVEQLSTLLEEIYQLKSHCIDQMPKGQLKIHSTTNIWPEAYATIINNFSAMYPKITIQYEEKSPTEVFTAVLNDPKSMGVFVHITHPNFEGNRQIPPQLDFFPAYDNLPTVFAAKNSAFAQKYKSISMRSLAKEPLVIYRPYSSSETIIDDFFAPVGGANIGCILSNLRAFHEILNNGLYLSMGVSHHRNYQDISEKLVAIPIKDTIFIKSGLLINRQSAEDEIIEHFKKFYLEQSKIQS